MENLSFNINKFVTAQLGANELGLNSKYNLYFVEYYIPSVYTDYINEIKTTDIEYIELADGSIHFHDLVYSDFVENEEIVEE